MTNKEKMIRILCDALDGCPLTYPCDKLWSPEGWCKDHCKAGQQEPDAECWLKYAEVMTSRALQAQDMYLAGAIVMTQAVLVVIGILFSDIALAFLDPRIRYSGGGR